MTADGERFDQGELLEAQLAGDVEFPGGYDEIWPQASIAMDAERLVLFAAVRMAAAAGVTSLAVDVRLDSAAVARFDVSHAGTDFYDLDAKFMPGDAGS